MHTSVIRKMTRVCTRLKMESDGREGMIGTRRWESTTEGGGRV